MRSLLVAAALLALLPAAAPARRLLRRTGAPQRQCPRSSRYCVEGGGRVVAAFGRRGRTLLVAASTRRATGALRLGARRPATLRRSIRGL